MSFGDHVILWLHVAAAIFTIGPGTAAIMSTPRYIRKQDPVVVGYLFRSTRIYSLAALLTLVFGLVLAGMTHKFSQWWIAASLTLFVVAFVLLVIILRDQRKALTALETAKGAAVTGPVTDGTRSEVTGQEAATGGAASGQPAAIAAAGAVQPAGAAAEEHRAAVERGRIVSLGGLTALIWLVILIFMVWH
jgi:Ca2+/Na+ antiporter